MAGSEPDDVERARREREVERERLAGLVGAARERYRTACERLQEFTGIPGETVEETLGEDGGSSRSRSRSRPGARPPDGTDSDDGACGMYRIGSTSSLAGFKDPGSTIHSPFPSSPFCIPDAWSETGDSAPQAFFDSSWFLGASFTPPLPHATILAPAFLALAEETALVLELLSKAGTVEMDLEAQKTSLLRACENTALLRREAGVPAPPAMRVDGVCVVCCDDVADAVLLPCRHLLVCQVGTVCWRALGAVC